MRVVIVLALVGLLAVDLLWVWLRRHEDHDAKVGHARLMRELHRYD